jgi:hypothetical protein
MARQALQHKARQLAGKKLFSERHTPLGPERQVKMARCYYEQFFYFLQKV